MIVVHHLENSRSHRILWLLEELGVPYALRGYARDPQTLRAPATLRAVHPLGKSPVIEDGDVRVAESGAIVEYLVGAYDRDGALAPPPGSAARRRWTYWLHFAEGSAMPPLLLALLMRRLAAAPMPFFVRPVAKALSRQVLQGFVQPELERILTFLEAELAAGPWFAGDAFSAADIQLSFPVEALATRGGLDARFPRLLDWRERCRKRPANARAEARGGALRILG